MTWVKVDDAFYDHPKFAQAGPTGIAQFVVGLAYSNRNLTNGFIPMPVARRLIDWGDGDGLDASEHLVRCRLWEPADGGYLIHDYLDWQRPRDDILAARKSAARAGRASAEARKRRSGTARPGPTDPLNDPFNGALPNGLRTDPRQADATTIQAPSEVQKPRTPRTDRSTDSQQIQSTEKLSSRASARARAHPAPDTFPITDDMRTWAAEKNVTADLQAETEKFLDHHAAKGSRFIDWRRAWQTWMRNTLDFTPRTNGRRPADRRQLMPWEM